MQAADLFLSSSHLEAPVPFVPEPDPCAPPELLRVLRHWCDGARLPPQSVHALCLFAAGLTYPEIALRLQCDRFKARRLCNAARRAVVNRARDETADPRARRALTLHLEGAEVQWVALALRVAPERVAARLGRAVRDALGDLRTERQQLLDCLREDHRRRGRPEARRLRRR